MDTDSRRPVTWADYRTARMAAVKQSGIISIPHVVLFVAALATVAFLR